MKKKRLKAGQCVWISWIDSTGPYSVDWEANNTSEIPDLSLIESVGFVVKSRKEVLAIAQHVGKNYRCCVMAIPWVAVKSWKVIK